MPTRGLPKGGNRCFINVCLQALARLKSLREWLEKPENLSDLGTILTDMFQEMENGVGEIVPKSKAYQNMLGWVYSNDDIVAGSQDDAHLLLHTIIKELKIKEFSRSFTLLKRCTSCLGRPNTSVPDQTLFDFACMMPASSDIQKLVNGVLTEDTGTIGLCPECNSDGEKLYNEQVISSYPSIIMVWLPRDIQLQRRPKCRMQKRIRLEQVDSTDGSTVQHNYHLVASINHDWFTSVSGHYTVDVKEDDKFTNYDDNDFSQVRGVNVKKCYVVFYEANGPGAQLEAAEDEEFEEEVEEEDDHFDINSSRRLFINGFLDGEYNPQVMKKWSFLFLVPHEAAGPNLESRLNECKSPLIPNTLLVLTYPKSRLREKILKSDFQINYDLYELVVYKNMAYRDVYYWLADFYLFFVAYTHLMAATQGLELILQKTTGCLATKSILLSWRSCSQRLQAVANTSNQFTSAKVFCFDDCAEDCEYRNSGFHLCTKDAKQIPFKDSENEDLYKNLRIRGKALSKHPFKCILSAPSYDPKPGKSALPTEIIEEMINDSTPIINELNKTWVYTFLIITPPVGIAKPTKYNYSDAIKIDGTETYVYTGCTRDQECRETHFLPVFRLKSAVWEILKPNSAIFLIQSERLPTLRYARRFEAAIIASCKLRINIPTVANLKLPSFELLNKMSKINQLNGLGDELRGELEKFVLSDKPFFQDQNGREEPTRAPRIGNYKIMSEIDIENYREDI